MYWCHWLCLCLFAVMKVHGYSCFALLGLCDCICVYRFRIGVYVLVGFYVCVLVVYGLLLVCVGVYVFYSCVWVARGSVLVLLVSMCV